MAKSKSRNLLGSWSFLIGVILAVVLSLFGAISQPLTIVLVVVGLLVGLLNVADEEVNPFLISGVSLIIASVFGQSVVSAVPVFDRVLVALSLIFVPATIIVAIKNVFSIARN